MGLVGAGPLLGCDDFLSFVVDVVDGAGHCAAILVLLVEAEGVEGGDFAQVEVVHDLFVVPLGEGELGLADDFLPGVEDVVVIGRGVVVSCAVGVADQHVDVRGGLPDAGDFEDEIIDLVLCPQGVVDLDDCVDPLRVYLEAVRVEFDGAVVLGRPPDDLGVVVALGDWHAVNPLSLAGLVGRHLAQFGIVGVVGEEEPVVSCCASLHHAEQFGIVEDQDVHAGSVLVGEGMGEGSYLMLQEVDHFDFVLVYIEDDGFSLVEHAEGVHRVHIVPFPKSLAFLIDVDQPLHGLLGGGDEEEAVEGGAEPQDLEGGALEAEGLGVLDQQHLLYCLCKNYILVKI